MCQLEQEDTLAVADLAAHLRPRLEVCDMLVKLVALMVGNGWLTGRLAGRLAECMQHTFLSDDDDKAGTLSPRDVLARSLLQHKGIVLLDNPRSHLWHT